MLWCIFIADKLIDRVRTQQRLLHLVHLYGLRRVDYMRRCILLGIEKKRKVGAAGWCSWCGLLVREEEKLVKLVVVVVLKFNFHPLAASLCDCRHSREYMN